MSIHRSTVALTPSCDTSFQKFQNFVHFCGRNRNVDGANAVVGYRYNLPLSLCFSPRKWNSRIVMSEFSELCSLLQGTGYGNQLRTLGVGTDALDSIKPDLQLLPGRTSLRRRTKRRTAILTYALAGAE